VSICVNVCHMAIKYTDGVARPPKPDNEAKGVRAQYLSGQTVTAQKPWEAEGISRRTWYRRKRDAREK